jgi:predicted short-subunit dehydrogenase-like oxidoreductase (DUF2520 family)
MSKLNIVLIGSGNVATHLGKVLKKAKHNILQVFSPTLKSAKILATQLCCAYTNQTSNINPNADIYIIAIKDDAIAELGKKLKVKSKIVVHTSGSVSMDAIKNTSTNYGVFYPLQTFSKAKKVNFKSIPICLESSNFKTLKTLQTLANSISNNVLNISSEQRQNIHIAAVFACNFSNHMYAIADELLKANKLNLDLIKPLIAETSEKIQNNAPESVQTGPAIRGDKKTIKKHLDAIEKKEYKKLYQLISKNIQSHY